MKDNGFFVILSTCPDAQVAERLARTLVEESLAACVNIVPGLRSIYRWNDAVQSDEEVLMIVKTTAGCLEAARERLVVESCRTASIPLACVLGGGDDTDITALAARHAILFAIATGVHRG
mgnify:CR=1 FL=1